MTYRWKANISKHQRYYNNPLNTIPSIVKLKLLEYGFKKTKRVSMRGQYGKYRMKLHNLKSCRYKRNPVVWIMESKNDRRVFGKFNR